MASRISVGRAQFTQALQTYRDRGALTDEGEEELEWYWGYAGSELGFDRKRMGAALGWDATTVHNLLAGNRTAGLESVIERITQLRKRTAGTVSELIETRVTRRIFQALDYARTTNSMVVVRGETGRSKTFSAEEWTRRNNHGRTIYVRCPSGCTRAKLVRAIAKVVGVGCAGKGTAEIEQQIVKGFNRRRTLIIDEAGHLVPTKGSNAKDMLDFVRDVHDMCGSGVALIFTSVYWDEIRTGRMAPFFEQFIGRVRYNLHIPEDTLFRDEIQDIVEAHGFSPDVLGTAGEIAHEDGKLRTLFGDLANARKMAERNGAPLDDKLLKGARAWRHSGGAWKEDTI